MSKNIIEVCKIEKIENHPNADMLRIATVKGWNCIIGLNDFKEGELVVFCPEDSIIPPNLIEKYNLEYLKKNGRLKAVKLRGFISQGLILPNERNWKLGQDVAEKLGITKYEPPASKFQSNLEGKKRTRKKLNPLFDKYTDIENIRNYNTVFKESDKVIITEKIHGTNFRAGNLPRYRGNLWGKIKSFLFGKYEFVYGSHNVQVTHHNNRHCFYGEDVYGQIAKKYNLREIIPNDYIIYGEIYGRGIQKNYEYGLKNIDIVFFDVKKNGKYLDFEEFTIFCFDRKLPTAPPLNIGQFSKEVLEKAIIGQSTLYNLHIKEGCVIKSYKEENHPQIGRKILKCLNPEYLLIKDRTDFK